jgi:REP element-mobilizing transposase RayT
MFSDSHNWNLPAPPEFQGFRDDLPLEIDEQHLPHWRQPGATYFVTFRLGNSLPVNRVRELQKLRSIWESKTSGLRSQVDLDEFSRELFRRLDRWLDSGSGSCVLRNPELAALLVKEMHKSDETRAEIGCYVIMPNHVHAIVRPLQTHRSALDEVVRAWKGASAFAINRTRGATGRRWQREGFDRIIRDEEHLYRVIQYIGRNPRRAGLDPKSTPLWLRPSWQALGWRFEGDSQM